MRWHWGSAVALVYTLFAASTLGFVVFALSRPVELVGADYYERGLQQDQRAAAQRLARGLGEGLQVVARADRPVLDVVIPPEATRDAAGTIVFYRPSDARCDRTVRLSLDARGHQEVPVDALARGRWIVRLEWRAQGRDYAHEQALVLR